MEDGLQSKHANSSGKYTNSGKKLKLINSLIFLSLGQTNLPEVFLIQKSREQLEADGVALGTKSGS